MHTSWNRKSFDLIIDIYNQLIETLIPEQLFMMHNDCVKKLCSSLSLIVKMLKSEEVFVFQLKEHHNQLIR